MLPEDAAVAIAYKFGNRLSSTAPVICPDETQETPTTTYKMYLDTFPTTIKRILGTLVTQDIDSAYWLSALRDGDATIGTDGSVKDRKGSFAVAIHAKDKQITFAGPVDCDPKLISSYRAELTAILAALYFIQTLHLYHDAQLTT
eukprot:13125323-Ditylum_brightwellii.AAC.1